MAKKASKKTGGGRKPATWNLVSRDQFTDYFTKWGLNNNSFAKYLGVSPGQVKNWLDTTKDMAPSRKVQERIKPRLDQDYKKPEPGSTPAKSKRGSEPMNIRGYSKLAEEVLDVAYLFNPRPSVLVKAAAFLYEQAEKD